MRTHFRVEWKPLLVDLGASSPNNLLVRLQLCESSFGKTCSYFGVIAWESLLVAICMYESASLKADHCKPPAYSSITECLSNWLPIVLAFECALHTVHCQPLLGHQAVHRADLTLRTSKIASSHFDSLLRIFSMRGASIRWILSRERERERKSMAVVESRLEILSMHQLDIKFLKIKNS